MFENDMVVEVGRKVVMSNKLCEPVCPAEFMGKLDLT